MSEYRLYRVMRDLEGKHCGNEYLGNLVTCGECKHWTNGDDTYGICYRCPNTRQMRYDDFCSRGDRKGE